MLVLDYFDGFSEFSSVQSHEITKGKKCVKPLLSILIPTFRRPLLVRQAVLSVVKQDVAFEYEVIVVDNDCSSNEIDSLLEDVDSDNLFLYRNEKNIGMFGNWNRCIELARGEWLTILNDDDLFVPGCLDNFYSILIRQPFSQIVFLGFKTSDMRCLASCSLDSQEGVESDLKRIYVADFFYGNNRAGSLGVFYRTKNIMRLGGFNKNLFPTADFVLNIRYILEFGFAFSSELISCIYRIGENESLKPETLEGFVINDRKMRLELSSQSRFPVIARTFSHFLVKSHAHNLEKFWKINLNIKKLVCHVDSPIWTNFVPLIVSRLVGKFFRRFVNPRIFFDEQK